MSNKQWLCVLGMMLVFWIGSAAVRDYGVQSEYDELNAKYKVVSEENSDLQKKVFKRDLQIFKLEAEIVNLEAQIPK